jgi:hypothetical protein
MTAKQWRTVVTAFPQGGSRTATDGLTSSGWAVPAAHRRTKYRSCWMTVRCRRSEPDDMGGHKSDYPT